MNISFLLSHNPNPRFAKRMKVASDHSKVNLIYWDRDQESLIPYTIDGRVKEKKITIYAPIGNNLKRIIPFILFIPKAISNLKIQKPTNIHCGKIDMLIIAVLYKKLYDAQTSIIYEIGDLPRFVGKKGFARVFFGEIYKVLERWLCKSINKLVLTSEFHWEYYYRKVVNESKYVLIPNVPDDRYFLNFTRKRTGRLTIGFFGALRYPDQLRMLLEATQKLSINVVIAGTGKELDFVKDMENKYNHLTFLGPYNYSKDIASLYSKVDIVYSVYDLNIENVKMAIPNKLYESIHCEIPIIVADETKLGDFVRKHKIGLIVPYNNTTKLHDSLAEILNNKGLVEEYSFNCKKLKGNYNYNNIKNKMIHLYRS